MELRPSDGARSSIFDCSTFRWSSIFDCSTFDLRSSTGPLLPAFLPSKISKKELAHVAQLDAAARGTYVLHNDLDTIDRLVERLYAGVEDDKLLIRLGLARGRDRHPIHEVAKQLQKNHRNFLSQIKDLEEHICLCVAAINRARSLLLDEIRLYQSHYS